MEERLRRVLKELGVSEDPSVKVGHGVYSILLRKKYELDTKEFQKRLGNPNVYINTNDVGTQITVYTKLECFPELINWTWPMS